MPDKHAKLSPSSAARWILCPPSASLEAEAPDTTSEAAAEGTDAHELAELIIKYNTGAITKRTYTGRLNKFKRRSEFYCAEMDEAISGYTDAVWEKFNEAKKKTSDAVLLSEHRVNLSRWIPDGFGTVDVTIIADGTLEIVDLKYGKGVKVDAPKNPQLRSYALGAVAENELLYDIKRVRMTIMQPRLDHISTEELTIDELNEWAEETLKPAAALAYEGKGEFCPGEEQCRFCRIRETCRARAQSNLTQAKSDFALPPELTDDEVAELLPKLDELISWAKDVQSYALQAALDGVKFDGYKLVEGRSNRRYTDEAAVAAAIMADGYGEDDVYKKKLFGITEMEKKLGKKHFAELTKGLIEKPQGKPVLVPESDKRPAFNSVDSARDDFKEGS